MDRTVFSSGLREAAAAARIFGQTFVSEALPESMRYRVFLSQSMDHQLRPDEVVYPEDREGPLDLAEQEVLDLLWRSGKVPEWIDISVCDASPDVTVLQVLVCGRFTANDELLYHRREGRPPFHVTSPPLPPGHQEGEQSSIRILRARLDARLHPGG